MRPQESPAELERRRRWAVQLLEGGQSLVAVAGMVGAAASAVWQWRATFRRAGADGLAAQPAPGRPPKLSPQQRQRLPQLLAVGAQHYGYPNDLWPRLTVQPTGSKKYTAMASRLWATLPEQVIRYGGRA